jgi:phosphoglucomutase
MVAREGKSVRELLERLYGEVGRFVTARQNIGLTPELDSTFADKLAQLPLQFAGQRVSEVVVIDGTKVLLEGGGWLLFRKSGTEPVVRLYGEASSDGQLAALMRGGREFILS